MSIFLLTCRLTWVAAALYKSRMDFGSPLRLLLSAAAAVLLSLPLTADETFRVATYNVENYLDVTTGTRKAKSAAAKAQIRESIRALKPEVLALQEMGGTNALLELRATLKSEGLDYPHWEQVTGFDTNIHVAVLSQYPFSARRAHTNESYLLQGRRLRISRGFVELDVRVNPRYTFTLLAAHLKSKRPVPEADQAEMREQEALLLRKIIDSRLLANPTVNLIVLGDFNDTYDSKPVKIIKGRWRSGLTDTRPTERNGVHQSSRAPHPVPRNIAWTYHYAKQDTYERIDYIFLSHGMAREWQPDGTFIFTSPDWGVGSDHRPIVATFIAEDR